MTMYAIDAERQGLRATGIVEAVQEWAEDTATGRRRPTDVQARSEGGAPLWAVEVTFLTESFGRLSTAVAKVTVPAPEQPGVAIGEVVPFTGLSVQANSTKTGGLRESWQADGIGAPATRRRGESD